MFAPPALRPAGSMPEKPPSRAESGAGGGRLGPSPARRGGGRTAACPSVLCSCPERDAILTACQGLRWPCWPGPTAAAGRARTWGAGGVSPSSRDHRVHPGGVTSIQAGWESSGSRSRGAGRGHRCPPPQSWGAPCRRGRGGQRQAGALPLQGSSVPQFPHRFGWGCRRGGDAGRGPCSPPAAWARARVGARPHACAPAPACWRWRRCMPGARCLPPCSCLAAYLGHSCAKHKYFGRRPGALAFLGVESAPTNAA